MVDEVYDSIILHIKERHVWVNKLPKHIEKPKRPKPEKKGIKQNLSSLTVIMVALVISSY